MFDYFEQQMDFFTYQMRCEVRPWYENCSN